MNEVNCTKTEKLPKTRVGFLLFVWLVDWLLGYIQQCSGVILGYTFRNYSWWCSGEHKRYGILNPGELHASQVSTPLYYLSGLKDKILINVYLLKKKKFFLGGGRGAIPSDHPWQNLVDPMWCQGSNLSQLGVWKYLWLLKVIPDFSNILIPFN